LLINYKKYLIKNSNLPFIIRFVTCLTITTAYQLSGNFNSLDSSWADRQRFSCWKDFALQFDFFCFPLIDLLNFERIAYLVRWFYCFGLRSIGILPLMICLSYYALNLTNCFILKISQRLLFLLCLNNHFSIFYCLKYLCFKEYYRFSCHCAFYGSFHCCHQMDLSGSFKRIAQASCLVFYLSKALIVYQEVSHSYSLRAYLDLSRGVVNFQSFFCFSVHLCSYSLYLILDIDPFYHFFFMILEWGYLMLLGYSALFFSFCRILSLISNRYPHFVCLFLYNFACY